MKSIRAIKPVQNPILIYTINLGRKSYGIEKKQYCLLGVLGGGENWGMGKTTVKEIFGLIT